MLWTVTVFQIPLCIWNDEKTKEVQNYLQNDYVVEIQSSLPVKLCLQNFFFLSVKGGIKLVSDMFIFAKKNTFACAPFFQETWLEDPGWGSAVELSFIP